MGGIGMGLGIEAVAPPEGKKRSTPRALHKALTASMRNAVWSRCGRGFLRPVAGSYLSDEVADGYRDRLYSFSETELVWGFMDHAGCCSGSMCACFHWWQVLLCVGRKRYDRMAAGRGWRITEPQKSPAATVLSVDYPLIDYRGTPMCVPPFVLGKIGWEDEWGGPFWDDGSPRPQLADLDPKEREDVLAAAIAGRCRCRVCRDVFLYLCPKPGLLERAWLRTAEPAVQEACAEAAAELLAGDWTPRTEPRGAHAAVCALFADSGLEPLALAGLSFRVVRARG